MRTKKQEIDALVNVCVKKGLIADAREAAKLGNRELTQEEIDALVNVCVKQGRIADAREAAKLGNRELTQEEIVCLRKNIDV